LRSAEAPEPLKSCNRAVEQKERKFAIHRNCGRGTASNPAAPRHPTDEVNHQVPAGRAAGRGSQKNLLNVDIFIMEGGAVSSGPSLHFRKPALARVTDRFWPGFAIGKTAHLTAMMRGHYAYYGISGNFRRIRWYAYQVARIWQSRHPKPFTQPDIRIRPSRTWRLPSIRLILASPASFRSSRP